MPHYLLDTDFTFICVQYNKKSCLSSRGNNTATTQLYIGD